MEKIVSISNIERDNQTKYGEYARYKVEVETINDRGLNKHIDYLDEKQIEKDIETYIDGLKINRNQIHFKSLKQRMIYNSIMALLGTAIFFTILGVGNLLISVGANEMLISVLGNLLIPISISSGFIYVNNRKFYYSKQEIEKLDKIKNEITRCNNIEAEIYKMKQKGKMFEYDYQRLNKDYEATRERNKERNIDMKLQEHSRTIDRDKRMNEGINKKVLEMSKRSHSVNNVDFEYFKNSIKSSNRTSLQKNSSFKEIKNDLEELIRERINMKEQEKYSANSFERGEKRRR